MQPFVQARLQQRSQQRAAARIAEAARGLMRPRLQHLLQRDSQLLLLFLALLLIDSAATPCPSGRRVHEQPDLLCTKERKAGLEGVHVARAEKHGRCSRCSCPAQPRGVSRRFRDMLLAHSPGQKLRLIRRQRCRAAVAI